jgi:hypothetical protein
MDLDHLICFFSSFGWDSASPHEIRKNQELPLMENNTKMMREGADRLFRLSGVLYRNWPHWILDMYILRCDGGV